MISHRNNPSQHAGFTLVEMLVVVAIITILAAILVPAVFLGLNAATDARIAIEISNMDAAIQQYKTLYGSYPPSTANAAQAKAHVQKLFPRWDGTSNAPPALTPTTSLVFWLEGYGPNPLNPLADRKRLFDFDETRKTTTYYPKSGQQTPYVYFHKSDYGTAHAISGKGTAIAYKSDATSDYANSTSYQIISAGQDGDYGNSGVKSFPSGSGYNDKDHDNITNFSEGTLGDKIE